MKAQTLYDKIIELHTIENLTADGTRLLCLRIKKGPVRPRQL
ncbi:hypothetical protein [Turicimonas muris]|nr:hypothetical protein [Turicimonas muris]